MFHYRRFSVVNCSICNNKSLDYQFSYNSKIAYYRCQVCGIFQRIPDNILINYHSEYTTSDNISKSKNLALNYFKRLKTKVNLKSDCLEIGGSFGFFGKLLIQENVCKVINIELSEYACKFSNSLGVEAYNNIDSVNNQKFDYIFAFHIVEHIETSEIKPFFYKLIDMLNDNGQLIVFTPNADSIKLNLLKQYFSWLAPDEHISFLSSKTLNFIFEDTNKFKLLIETSTSVPAFTHFPINSFLSYLRGKLISRKCSNIQANPLFDASLKTDKSLISISKQFYKTLFKIESCLLIPFYLLFDLFSNQHDELTFVVRKTLSNHVDNQ